MKLNAVYIIFIVYLCTAFFSTGHIHADEYFQILEFAAYKLHLSHPTHLPWEFYSQIRPTIQAFVVVYLYKSLQFFTPSTYANPFTIALITRLLSATLSLYAAYLFYLQFKKELHTTALKKWFLLLSFFSYLTVLNSVRYASENISSKLFIVALCLILSISAQKNLRLYWRYLFFGILLGLSFIVRYQTGFMIAGFIAWLLCIRKLNTQLLLVLLLGIATAIVGGILIDHWFYGDWVFTAWTYFESNIINHVAASFGTSPWYYYGKIALYLPYGILYVVCTPYFIYRYRKHVVTWVITPFLLAHLLIGHKELRFLTPLLPLMPLVIMLCIQSWKLKSTHWLLLVRVAWYLNCAVLLILMVRAPVNLDINQLFYKKYQDDTLFYTLSREPNNGCDKIPDYSTFDFYLPKNTQTICVKNSNDIHCNNTAHCVVKLNCIQDKLLRNTLNGKLIASNCPAWLYKINVGNWLKNDRQFGNLYELQKK